MHEPMHELHGAELPNIDALYAALGCPFIDLGCPGFGPQLGGRQRMGMLRALVLGPAAGLVQLRSSVARPGMIGIPAAYMPPRQVPYGQNSRQYHWIWRELHR